MSPERPTIAAAPSIGLLLRLKLRLLRNRLRQTADQSPWRLLLVVVFVGAIWVALYTMFEHVFVFLRTWRQEAVIAIPYVFHIFFVAMTFLLAFSTAVLTYGALFGPEEPAFLLATPHPPWQVVAVMYLEALFFASWSLLLLGMPLMFAIGRVQGLPWHFYVTFLAAFLAFVPVPGALGLTAAWAVAMWLPRSARRVAFYVGVAALGATILWWGRLWAISPTVDASQWLRGFLGELQYLKAALLPSTWVSHAIRFSIEERPLDAWFYVGVTVATALFFSWLVVNLVGRHLLTAFGRAHGTSHRSVVSSGWASLWLTRLAFFYLPRHVRTFVLKDVRSFLRDPVQWSQLAILFGLLGLYLLYLPRTRPEGFSLAWKAFICFLNYGAVTLILSTFTSRFVFPMVSVEGRQMWLVGLLPLPRSRVMWAKFDFALTITSLAALTVTVLSIRALDLPGILAMIQFAGTLSTCVGLCGLSVGLGARLPSYHERNTGRIASGLGGTVNLIASISLVTASIFLMGVLCYRMVQAGRIDRLDEVGVALYLLQLAVGFGVGTAAMRFGIRAFQRAEF